MKTFQAEQRRRMGYMNQYGDFGKETEDDDKYVNVTKQVPPELFKSSVCKNVV